MEKTTRATKIQLEYIIKEDEKKMKPRKNRKKILLGRKNVLGFMILKIKTMKKKLLFYTFSNRLLNYFSQKKKIVSPFLVYFCN